MKLRNIVIAAVLIASTVTTVIAQNTTTNLWSCSGHTQVYDGVKARVIHSAIAVSNGERTEISYGVAIMPTEGKNYWILVSVDEGDEETQKRKAIKMAKHNHNNNNN